MDVVISTPVRLFGDCLERSFGHREEISVVRTVHDMAELRRTLERTPVDLVLVDITDALDCQVWRAFADDFPGTLLLAIGLPEQEDAVVRCGEAGFAGYVPRHASFETLQSRMIDAMEGRLSCPQHISAGLLKALARRSSHPESEDKPVVPIFLAASTPRQLSPREIGVARLLRQGCSNKEIARTLNISLATVKHHVHSILEKLGLKGRSFLMLGPAVWDSNSPVPATHAISLTVLAPEKRLDAA